MDNQISGSTTINRTGQYNVTHPYSGSTGIFYNPTELIKKEKKIIDKPTFKVKPLVQAMEEVKDTVRNQKNLFGDLVTQGDLTIIFGRSGTGKSFLAYQFAEAIASGKNVLDVMNSSIVENYNNGETKYYNLNNETQKQIVLYADFEATIENDYIRYTDKDVRKNPDVEIKPYQFNTNFIVAVPDRLTVMDNLLFLDVIEEEVKKWGAKVLIIDNIAAISQENEKSSSAAKLMNKIKDIQRRNKLTVLVMAHTPKIVNGESIIWTNLAGSSNLYNLAESVFAIGTTTMDEDVRYLIQLKSRYNEIQFHSDNVIAIKFKKRLDGFKGFVFLNYENEASLIKSIDKATKDDENKEIIDLVKHFGFGAVQIAEELHPKYGKDVELSTYKERIYKRLQRLKNKGLIPDEKSSANVVKLSNSNHGNDKIPLQNNLKTAPDANILVKIPENNHEVIPKNNDSANVPEAIPKGDISLVNVPETVLIDDYSDIPPY